MSYNFDKERAEVLAAAKAGIRGNLKLSGTQKKYVKNLLLFALMRASNNGTVTPRNFLKLVNKLFKEFLLKIIKDGSDDDDDTDWEEALDVELNQIIANDEILRNFDIESLLTPQTITSFLTGATKGVSQKDLIKRLMALRDAKINHRETPSEQKEREQRQKEYELMKLRQRTMIMERGSRGSRERG